MTDTTLAEATAGRERISRQRGGVHASRPPAGAGPEARAGWLLDRAGVHDQLADQLRRIGDVAGAVQSEVLASRCRVDARDLIRASGTALGIPGAAAGRAAGTARTPAAAPILDRGPLHRDRGAATDAALDTASGPAPP